MFVALHLVELECWVWGMDNTNEHIQLIQLRLSFQKLKPETLSAQGMMGYCLSPTYIYPIQHGRECCKWLVKYLDENIRILQQFKINE